VGVYPTHFPTAHTLPPPLSFHARHALRGGSYTLNPEPRNPKPLNPKRCVHIQPYTLKVFAHAYRRRKRRMGLIRMCSLTRMFPLCISIQETQEAHEPNPCPIHKHPMARQVDGGRARARKRYRDGNGLIITWACIAYSL
jgi:hypothetical protein